jgi:hypothetical protein
MRPIVNWEWYLYGFEVSYCVRLIYMCDDVGVDFCYIGLDMILDDKGFKWGGDGT